MTDMSILTTYKQQAVTEHMLPDNFYPNGVVMPDPELIFGIELEIEDYPRGRPPYDGVRLTTDGSLRNNGVEGISIPFKAKSFSTMLHGFFNMRPPITAANYSERCSTHVHMNVQDYNWPQLKVLCIIYQMFERLLFAFIGNDRKDNIFCVPWYESGVTSRVLGDLQKNSDSVIKRWMKYSALNLLPIRTQGSVEFRHMQGTCDVDLIMTWLRLLSRLSIYAKKTPYKTLMENVLQMNTVSNYDQFLSDVFGEDRYILRTGNYQEALSTGVVDTKLMMLNSKTSAKKSFIYDDILAEPEPRVARPAAPPPRNLRYDPRGVPIPAAGPNPEPVQQAHEVWLRDLAIRAQIQREREAQVPRARPGERAPRINPYEVRWDEADNLAVQAAIQANPEQF